MMKYYIIKPRKATVDNNIIAGIKESDHDAVIVQTLDECDVAVMQKGCTRSKFAVNEIRRQKNERRKPCREGSVYLDRWKAHLNCGQ